jgi:hypothetical protein
MLKLGRGEKEFNDMLRVIFSKGSKPPIILRSEPREIKGGIMGAIQDGKIGFVNLIKKKK